jgi:predicted GNAT superfamily acetyltransferase
MVVKVTIRILEDPHALAAVERLQAKVWTGSEIEIVPVHMLVAAIHNGGLVIGAYAASEDGAEELVGFVFGFPGLVQTPDGPQPKHHSHMMGVHPQYRGQQIGFSLKRAQWQMVRHQGLDRITWTYDPLLSRNAYLNITRLGAVCNTYLEDEYGSLRDGLNLGLPSDRFQVDWWLNSSRVNRRLSRRARAQLDLANYYAGGAELLNPTRQDPGGWPIPPRDEDTLAAQIDPAERPLLLLEIPADFHALKAASVELAAAWRQHTRRLFSGLFGKGYLATDFVYLPGTSPRSFYVLAYGESTL